MKQPLPVSLKIVAWLFILFGSLTAMEMILSLMKTGRTILNITAIALLIGIGLLQRSNTARIAALVYLWLAGILTAIGTIAFFTTPAHILVWGQRVDSTSPILVAAFFCVLACFTALAVWEYRVLTNPEIKSLFRKSG